MIETKLVWFTCKAQSFYYMTPQDVSFDFHCVWIKVVCMYVILNYRCHCILVTAALNTSFNNHSTFKEIIFFYSFLWSSSSQPESSFGSTAVINEIMEWYHKVLIQPSKKKNIQFSIRKRKGGWFFLLLLFLPYSLLPLKRFHFKFYIASPGKSWSSSVKCQVKHVWNNNHPHPHPPPLRGANRRFQEISGVLHRVYLSTNTPGFGQLNCRKDDL